MGKGYGQFYRRKREPVGAHRFSWELANGRSVPAGRQVMHSCDNPPCVNPAHLSVGTCADNNRDKSVKGRNPGNQTTRGRPERTLDVDRIRAMRSIGMSYREIGRVMNTTASTIWRNLND